ncbi:flavin-binding monooxygenase-like protein-like protein [Paraphoma chrysanthemicola]|uniref:Flavin-binding monooxygenase-like protein-like protein n=1 Tax=Paraphoma chrysanthemicola TaxID=798071 RepID=A0A8K0VY71_9PLEO|nr:flavin-binding monooxygenase-like protein-like protein [Paraphoma chrysanthemicola]
MHADLCHTHLHIDRATCGTAIDRTFTSFIVMNDNDFEVVLVGAGLSGIVAAARYLQRHPKCKLTIIEQDGCVGGSHGIAEFTDFLMERAPEEDCMNDLFKSKYTGKYLEDYVDHIKVDGHSLRDRIHFNIHIQSVEKRDGRRELKCKIVHLLDFGQSDIIKNNRYQHIAVLGGSKPALDMVYESVKAGKTVSWVIRKTGDGSTGPGFFAPVDIKTPYRNAGYAAQTRAMSSFQPCFMVKDTWWTWFLHQTSCGIGLVKWIFQQADKAIRSHAVYTERESTKGFAKLKYKTELFWQNGVGGAVHHADTWPLIAEKVHVHRGRVKRLMNDGIYLDDEDGTHFPCDAILCGTGWHRGLDMFSDKLKAELGLPYPRELTLKSPESEAKWKSLVADADKAMLKRFPILRHPPPQTHIESAQTPYNLYCGMVPLHDNSILFMGHITLGNKLFGAEAQAMWAVAYFDGIVQAPVEIRERDIATWTAWCKRRHLSNGGLANSTAFDSVSYVDILLQDMGVSAHCKKGWWKHWFEPVLPADLGWAWEEYLRQRKM